MGIVIARYHEDLRWVEQITSPYDIYIYNRHENRKTDIGNLNVDTVAKNGCKLEIIDMEDDPGREAGVYAYHCWLKHDSLNDFTIFLQGYPFDRRAKLMEQLNNSFGLKHTRYICDVPQPAVLPKYVTPQIVAVENCIEFEYIADSWITFEPHWDHGWIPFMNDLSKWPFIEFCGGVPRMRHVFGASGQFIVCKQRILKHDADYYMRLHKLCISYIDPIPDGIQSLHYGENMMEAIWEYTF